MAGLTADRRRMLVVLGVVIAVAVAGAALYYYVPGCDARIESCCLTTELAVIKVSGDCGDMRVRIVDRAGLEHAEFAVKPGLNTVNVSLPTEGKYLVELLVRGKVVDKTVVSTDKIPAVRSVTAVVSPLNWTLIVKVTSQGENSCVVRELLGGEFYIKQVVVMLEYKNGSLKNLTFNGHWPANGVIKLDLGLDRASYANVSLITVYVKDSLDYYYQAVAHFPG